MFTVTPNDSFATVRVDDKPVFDVVFSYAITDELRKAQIKQLFDMAAAANEVALKVKRS